MVETTTRLHPSIPGRYDQLKSDSAINHDSVDEERTRTQLRPRSTSLGILMRLEIIGGFIKAFTHIQWEIARELCYLYNHSSSQGQ